MANAVCKYGIMYKKINDTFVVVTQDDNNQMYQTPFHLLEQSKGLKPFYVNKDSSKVKEFAKQNGYRFANSPSDLI